LFLATGLASASGHPEEDESIKQEWIEPGDVPRMIASGEIRDAKSIAGLLWYLYGPKTRD